MSQKYPTSKEIARAAHTWRKTEKSGVDKVTIQILMYFIF
jgi:hypothetical protein